VRTGHSRDLAAYLRGEEITEPEEQLLPESAMDEYVMLRLRLVDGVDKIAFRARFGTAFDERYGALVAPYLGYGLLCDTPTHIAFTARGFDVSNTVLADLIGS
jgi:oxygen-independent coproporphyrinogen-3 oxidase